MAHIVTQPCLGCKNTACVEVCPVECFHEDAISLWINPDECIDCGACIPECPVDAIFPENKLPEKWVDFIERNREGSERCPVILERKEPLS